MGGSTVRSATLVMGVGHWTEADCSSSYLRHLDMEMCKMVSHHGLFQEKNPLLPWISGMCWKLLKVCLFLLSELFPISFGIIELMGKRGTYQQLWSHVGNNMLGKENTEVQLQCRHLSQSSAGPRPALPPQYEPPGGNRSMAEGTSPTASPCHMKTELERPSEMEFSCTNPLILAMIWPDTEENARSPDRDDEWSPDRDDEWSPDRDDEWSPDRDDELSPDRDDERSPDGDDNSEENMDDAESSDWSTDDDDDDDDEDNSCDESDTDLWGSFFQNDPYNPLNFSASTGHQHPTCQGDAEEDVSVGQLDLEESGNDELWDSFFQNTDPFNPLNFSACTTTRASSNQEVKEGASNTKLPETSGVCFNTYVPNGEQPALTLEQETSERQRKTGKKVRFSPVVEVHRMVVWDFASRAARKGPWEQCARDRSRFERRIASTEAAIGYCLDQEHRRTVWTRLYGK
ncbi:uncharacterized protein [Hemitrygon akajei]|uniref:uncharacterized protein n=1 Tax=Hemitrygon akajei TaxID=2704970 RepID=UPI003BFA13E3